MGWIEENEAVGMSCCEPRGLSGWVGGWVGGTYLVFFLVAERPREEGISEKRGEEPAVLGGVGGWVGGWFRSQTEQWIECMDG